MRIALLLCFLFSQVTQAAAPLSADRQLEVRIQNLQNQLAIFQQICMQDGKVISRVVTDGETSINCPHENDHLRMEIAALKKFTLKEEAIACGSNGSISSLAEQLASTHQAIQKHGISCSAQEAHQNNAACAGDIVCNLGRSLIYGVSPIGPLLRGLKGLEERVHSSAKKDSCMSTAKSDCFTELVAGVMADLWGNVQAVWQVAHAAGSWAKHKIISGWKYLWGVEDRSTEKMMAASKQSKSFVSLFLQDPWAAMKQMGQSIYQMVADGIRENFMCNRWSGMPHQSTCLEKNTQGWDCASCGQKLDAACGVIGFAGGEIVTAYLTGGVLAIGKSAGKIGLEVAGKIGRRVAEALPDFAKVALTATARATQVALELGSSQLGQRIESVLHSPASKAVINFSENSKKLGQSAWQLAASQSAITVPLSITLKGGKVLSYPIRKYLGLMDSALHLGLSHGDAAIVAAHNALVATGVVRTVDKSIVVASHTATPVAEAAKPQLALADHETSLAQLSRDEGGIKLELQTFDQEKSNLDSLLKKRGGDAHAEVEKLIKDPEGYLHGSQFTDAEKAKILSLHNSLVERGRRLSVARTARDLEELKGKATLREVDCKTFNALNGTEAFLPQAKCTVVHFTEDSSRYCSCGAEGRIGKWVLPCAEAVHFYETSGQLTNTKALPKDSAAALDECRRFLIPAGSTILHGGLGPAFSGYGADAQAFVGLMDSVRGSSNEVLRQKALQLGIVSPAELQPVKPRVLAIAPLVDDRELTSIYDLGRQCHRSGTAMCTPRELSEIEARFNSLLRNRPGALAQKEIEQFERWQDWLKGCRSLSESGGLSDILSSKPGCVLPKDFSFGKAATDAVALDDASRARVQESLRAKHITESNASSFFDKGNPIPLTDPERIYLSEHVLGFPLSAQEAKKILELHDIGKGYGQYTMAQLKEKAVGIRELLAARGIDDPVRVKTAIDTLLRQGILGKVPETEKAGLMGWLKGFFKGKGEAPTAAASQETALKDLENARANYIATKQEVLDPGLTSPAVKAATSIRADDLFAAQFRGTMHDMITKEAFRDEGIYAKGGGRELWWGETVLEGKDSLSPLSAVYGKSATGEVIPTRRTIYWPKDQIEAARSSTGRAEYPLNLQSYRVVTNEAFENGKWTQKSIEAIGRNANGEYVPMFYVRDGEKWVPSRTFQGVPVENACIKCHHHPANPSVFTAFPYSARPGLDIHQLSPLYQNDALKMIAQDKYPPVIGDRQGRPGTAPMKLKARDKVSTEELLSPETAERARKTAAKIGTNRDRRIAEAERVLGTLFEGRPGLLQKQAIHRAAELDEFRKRGPWTQADIELRKSILRYGKTPDELAALKAEGKPMPAPLFKDEEDVERIFYEGLIGVSP